MDKELVRRQADILKLYRRLIKGFSLGIIPKHKYNWQRLILDERMNMIRKEHIRAIEGRISEIDLDLSKYRRLNAVGLLCAVSRAYNYKVGLRRELEAELGFLRVANPRSYFKHLSQNPPNQTSNDRL